MFHDSRDVVRTFVKTHIKQPEDKDGKYKCDMCDEAGWSSETDAALHRIKFHIEEILSLVKQSSNKIPFCLVCLTKQPDVTALITHWKTSHLLSSPTAIRVERDIFICDLCRQLFFNKLLLQVHIHSMHKFDLSRTQCPNCVKRIRCATAARHLARHRAYSVSSCPICLNKCVNRSSLHKHITNTHTKLFLCNICGFVTTKLEIFNAHLKNYEDRKSWKSEDDRSIEYDKYFLKSLEYRSLSKTSWKKSLVKYRVRGLKLYNDINICIMCRQICVNKKEMKDHIMWDHKTYKMAELPEINLRICSCSEVFNNALLLKQHMVKMKHVGHRAIKQEEEEEALANLEPKKEPCQDISDLEFKVDIKDSIKSQVSNDWDFV